MPTKGQWLAREIQQTEHEVCIQTRNISDTIILTKYRVVEITGDSDNSKCMQHLAKASIIITTVRIII